jgi:hypothetical protein
MPPPYLIAPALFLGQSLMPGVNPVLAAKLAAVEVSLRAIFNVLPADQKLDPNTGLATDSFETWCGLLENHGTWRGNAGFHSSGSAIDVDTSRDPYIATRTFTTSSVIFGGERPTRANPLTPAQLQAIREPAVEVYDRAVQFMGSPSDDADVGGRSAGESTSDVYDRFAFVSQQLISYLAFACKSDLPRINRTPVASVETVATTVLDALPTTERRDKGQAVNDLSDFMTSVEFQNFHPAWPNTVEEQYYRILRDYELVRIPMVFGPPSLSPQMTRNPVRGFVNLRKEIVVAMCDAGGLRWGASDFGSAENGDVMHFDLGSHGGFTPSDT